MKRSIDTRAVRPKVTPDPAQAAALARRLAELSYTPENGFHRDQRQERKPRGLKL